MLNHEPFADLKAQFLDGLAGDCRSRFEEWGQVPTGHCRRPKAEINEALSVHLE